VGLKIRKLADKTQETRVIRFDPETGEKKLVNPATPGEDHEPWPLAGVVIEDEIQSSVRVPMSYVSKAIAEGWMTRVNEKVVVRPAGPNQKVFASSATGTPHVFFHADEIHIHTVGGDVKYKVTHQPDKYASKGDDSTQVTEKIYSAGDTRVDWFYDLELITNG
jgi:hypothetical protein